MKNKRDEFTADVEKNSDDYDARAEIARRLLKDRAVEALHEESDVRVWARLWGRQGYSLEVPVGCLDPRFGQRDRAKSFIQDAGYRAYDADLGPVPDVGDGQTWGYSRDQGGAREAADQAFRLLCKIAELPFDVRVILRDLPKTR